MDSYEDVCNVPLVRTYDGTEYTFARLSVDDMAKTAAHIRRTRTAILTESLNGVLLEVDVRAGAYAAVASGIIYTHMMFDDPEGRIMLIYLSLLKAGGTYALPKLRKEFPSLPYAAILELMLWITGQKAQEKPAADPTTITANDSMNSKAE